ncbi:MAG: glycosyltransferase family 2 protein [Candidatus Levybacteria bacterium]|nr:glycosyltransferase family 2 protein [Candidatus Levybacteria bacterium]
MVSISAVIITKNEESMIEDAIRSVSFCDEIIIIDNGSTDRTVPIARKHKAQVYEYASDDFSKSRNMGLRKAKGDWVLYIDADERVTKELMVHIKTVIANPQAKAAYRIKRKNYYFLRFEWPTVEKLERFFKRVKLRLWYGRLHESVVVDGEIGELDGFLVHYTHRSLSDMVNKTLMWSRTEAQLRLAANHPKVVWWRFPRVMLSAFYDSYVKQRGWKIGTPGLVESMYQAFSAFVTYAQLWEMQQERKTQSFDFAQDKHAKLKTTNKS